MSSYPTEKVDQQLLGVELEQQPPVKPQRNKKTRVA
jgi:hypothetical protein